MTCYGVFGLVVSSEFDLTALLPESSMPADITICRADVNLPAGVNRRRIDRRGSQRVVGVSSEGYYLDVPDVGRFFLGVDRIDCDVRPDIDPRVLERCLVGSILSLWCERQAMLVLHGATVGIGGHAVVFAAHAGSGKSSLAASFVQDGAKLLGDDQALMELRSGSFSVRQAYPTLRLAGGTQSMLSTECVSLGSSHVTDRKRSLTVNERAFSNGPLRLAAIYLLGRRDPDLQDGVQLQAVGKRNAIIELIRFTSTPRTVNAAGLQPRRLKLLTSLAGVIPVKHLIYPSGLHRLHEVKEAVRLDLRATIGVSQSGIEPRASSSAASDQNSPPSRLQ